MFSPFNPPRGIARDCAAAPSVREGHRLQDVDRIFPSKCARGSSLGWIKLYRQPSSAGGRYNESWTVTFGGDIKFDEARDLVHPVVLLL